MSVNDLSDDEIDLRAREFIFYIRKLEERISTLRTLWIQTMADYRGNHADEDKYLRHLKFCKEYCKFPKDFLE